MYQRKESLNDKVAMQFVWTLKRKGIDSSSMSTSMLMKAMLMHRTETY